ncbi:WD40-repeat-containing domain protein [Hygrophoropsis aurantiaca]|uniref:WD40-repeat-containing domain protein n=1 Tax=Hygrophoropsis aurantiaca TaxID=72124 RepID=A0ACB7ZXR9_9AGAM|nr:WD40-repeat-containing domain protein [Hygrophoropsis aurantiaca]
MSLRYTSRGSLRGEHNRTITCLAFSPNGLYIASGALDGKLSIWCTTTGKLVHVVAGAVCILALSWNSLSGNDILCGLADGLVVSLNIDDDLSATGYVAHRHPVERLAVSGTYVATGARNEVRLWWYENNEEWKCIASSTQPPYAGTNLHLEAIVTSLHWVSSGKSAPTTLLVSYMHHGIVFFDIPTFKITRFMPSPTLVGGTSLSPNCKFLAVSNLCTGFDVYDLDVNAPVMNLKHDVNLRFTVPVLFMHEGHAILGGSTCGKVRVWDATKGRHLHMLHHEENDIILAIAAHYDTVQDKFLVATGARAATGGAPYIRLWEAFDLCE